MAGGYTKAIEGVRPGDMVKSYDETTGEIENKCVLSTSVNETNEVVKVKTSGGETLVATPAHPFYANGDWIGAKDLRAGDILVNVNGEKVVVEQVSHEMLESSVKVYNFEVADNHIYLVGESGGVVVHNKDCNNGTYRFTIKMKDGTEAMYVGKGGKARMETSIQSKVKKHGTFIEGSEYWEAADSTIDAFIKESVWMERYAGERNKLLNQIASPGFKYSNTSMSKILKSMLLKKQI